MHRIKHCPAGRLVGPNACRSELQFLSGHTPIINETQKLWNLFTACATALAIISGHLDLPDENEEKPTVWKKSDDAVTISNLIIATTIAPSIISGYIDLLDEECLWCGGGATMQ